MKWRCCHCEDYHAEELKQYCYKALTSERLRAEKAEQEIKRLESFVSFHSNRAESAEKKVKDLEAELDGMAGALNRVTSCEDLDESIYVAREALTRYHARKGGKGNDPRHDSGV